MSLKVAVSGYYGFDNFGDEAVLKVLTDYLKQKDFQITVFSANPEKTSEKYNVQSVYTFDYLKVIFTIFKSDILVSGGGSLLQDVTGIKSVFYYLAVISCGILFQKDVIIFAQGIGPVNNPAAKFLMFFLFKKCKLITVRDKKSYNLLKSKNIDVHLLNDPVWDIGHVECSGKALGIQLRTGKKLPENFVRNLAKIIAENFSDKKIIVLPFQNSTDLEISKEFVRFIKIYAPESEIETIPFKNIEQTLEDIGKTDTLIAMRFHACLLGIKSKIKVLPIIYDTKVKKLADETGLQYRLYPGSKDMKKIIEDFKNSDLPNYKIPVFDFKIFDELYTCSVIDKTGMK